MNSGRFRSLSALVNVFLLKFGDPLQHARGRPINPLMIRRRCYAVRRFLPRARRRLTILRPCLVDIRFKNPWFRARLSRLG